jgi:hypothetical protein
MAVGVSQRVEDRTRKHHTLSINPRTTHTKIIIIKCGKWIMRSL